MPLILAAAVGFWALAGQFIVNRIIFFYIANSEYTAASIIALHLLGFWLGATVVRWKPMSPISLVAASLMASIVAEVVTWRLGAVVLGLPVTVVCAVLFGLTLASLGGALIVRLMQLSPDSQNVVVADTAGSVAGALVGGFVMLPVLGIHGSFGVLIAVQGVALAMLQSQRRYAALVAGGTGIALMLSAIGPAAAMYTPKAFVVAGMPVELKLFPDQTMMFNATSPYGYVSVIIGSERQQLNIDGRPLCATGKIWGNKERVNMSAWRTGSMPVKLGAKHPNARIANIGLGCGVTMAALLQEADQTASVDVIEINPEMPKAQRLFDAILPFTQDDPRIKLHLADGFRYFADYNGPKYDAVAIDVAWMQNMNATHLFSVEMYRNIRQHLTDDGVLGVWIEERNPISPTALVIYRTLREVFPYIVVDVSAEAVVFYASMGRNDMVNYLDERSATLSQSLDELMPVIPVNRLDNLIMNRTKFKWWGDSRWENLYEKYEMLRQAFWGTGSE